LRWLAHQQKSSGSVCGCGFGRGCIRLGKQTLIQR
jgi:hypothetical protein